VPTKKNSSPSPVFLFDLDGTLIDSVYQHVLAWREALETIGVELANWKIHRRIGMSGGLIVHAFTRDTGRTLDAGEAERLQKLHGEAYTRRQPGIRLLPGAKELLSGLTQAHVKWAIATSGKRDKAQFALDMLGVGDDVPVITRDDVERAKPAPDLFVAAAGKVGVDLIDCVVIGDSVWDLLAARRARALGVGLLSGGYGEEELTRAGAYRVYSDPSDLLAHLDEVGVRTS
jgi:HAD superfamily hydrolase (TIGR01509 family)